MCRRVWAVTRFSIPARCAARRMIAARIVGCRRLPSRPQKTGAPAGGFPDRAQPGELARERSREWLAARPAALAAADEQRRPWPVELEVGPVDGDQLRAAEAGLQEREQNEAVALGEAGALPRRVLGRCQQPGELLLGQPVGLLLGLRRRLELEEGIGQPAAATEPAEEAAQKAEAAVVGGRRRPSAPLGRRRGSRRSSLPRRRCARVERSSRVARRSRSGRRRVRFRCAAPPAAGAASRREPDAGRARRCAPCSSVWGRSAPLERQVLRDLAAGRGRKEGR